MFEDALRYPWAGEDRVERIAIGGVLTLLGVFLLPALIVYGYYVRVVRRVDGGDDDAPPPLGDWEALLADGVRAVVVGAVYALVPTAVVAVSVLGWFLFVAAAIGAESGAVGVAAVAYGAVTFALSAAVTLLALYLFPAGVAAFAVTGRLGAAFSPGTVRRIGTDSRYVHGLLVSVGIVLVANLTVSLLSLTGIGGVLAPFVSFYAGVAAAYSLGRCVADVHVA